MPHIKAMVIFQGATNVPEDRFVNTFHFVNTWADKEIAATALNPLLQAFYGDNSAGDNIGKWMPAFVSRTVQIRYYDMADPIQRVPALRTITLGAAGAFAPIPEECAVVCSFHGGAPITPRKRGRIYIGPCTVAMQTTSPTVGVRVSDAFQAMVATRAKALADSAANWVVYSPTNDSTVTVEGGFCDNAFDTMRKRGPKTTARNSWVAA